MNVFTKCFIGSTLFFTMATGHAQDVHGILRVVKGDVQIKSAKTGQTGRARIGAQVFPKDVILTGKDARAKIVMVDNNEINISPESQIEIQHYEYDPNKGKKDVLLNVIYGKVRAKVEQKYDGKSSKFQVKTPAAVAGVRGTDFMTSYNKSNSSSQVVTFKGAVEFGLPGPGGSITNGVSVTPGKVANSVAGSAPTPPAPMPKEQLAKLDNETKADTATPSGSSDRAPAGEGDSEKKDDNDKKDDSAKKEDGAKDEGKKDEGKKEEAKNDEGKKDEGKKDEGKKEEAKKEDGKKDDAKKEAKKDDAKKDEGKKEEARKDDTKKDDGKKQEKEAAKSGAKDTASKDSGKDSPKDGGAKDNGNKESGGKTAAAGKGENANGNGQGSGNSDSRAPASSTAPAGPSAGTAAPPPAAGGMFLAGDFAGTGGPMINLPVMSAPLIIPTVATPIVTAPICSICNQLIQNGNTNLVIKVNHQ